MANSDINPYASPQSESLSDYGGSQVLGYESPRYKLYSVWSIVLAAFFGSLVAGGAIIAINYYRMGRKSAAIQAVVYSILATIGVMILLVMLPENSRANVGILVGQLVALRPLSMQLFREAIEDHKRHGGRMASAWGALGIGILIGVFLAIVIVGFMFVWVTLSGGA